MAIRRMSTSSIKQNKRYSKMSGGTRYGLNVAALVVAGGGGGGSGIGGNQVCGGAGAGGYQELSTFVKYKSPETITVGAGGATHGKKGFNSVFGETVSEGGGGGGGLNPFSSPGSGGSGGGTHAGTNTPGSGISGQGNNGGDGDGYGGSRGGGGGGAGAVGVRANGGAGLASSITGFSVTRARGGNSWDGVAGPANSGNGGGGRNSGSGGTGGSGIIVFSLDATKTVSFSAGVTHSVSQIGQNNVYTVTAAGPTDTITINS